MQVRVCALSLTRFRACRCAIDLWSMGCVMAELYIGQPLFPGESGVDQLGNCCVSCRARVQSLTLHVCVCLRVQWR